MKRRINPINQTVLILVALLFLFPIYLVFVNGLKTPKDVFLNTLGAPEAMQWGNYARAWEMMSFGRAFLNSLSITAGSIVVIIIATSMAAWVLVRTKTRSSNLIFLVFVSAMIIPFQSVMLPLVSFMDRLGLLNSRIGIVFMYLGFGSSLSIFLYHGFIKSVPMALEEAAIIDGCPRWRILWLIVFPLLKSITVTIMILNIKWFWNDYLLPQLVLGEKALRTIPLSMFYFFGQYTKQWHLAMAALTLSIVPVILFFLIAQRYIIEGITTGSVK